MNSETKKVETSQLDKFKEAARQLGCDDDEKRFADNLGKIVRKPTEPTRRE